MDRYGGGLLVCMCMTCVACSAPALPPDIRFADPDPARARASDVVVGEIVRPATLTHDVVVRATAAPLPAGAEVRGFLDDDAPLVTDRRSWLFEVDDAPFALFEHPVRHVLVDAESDAVLEVREHRSWALVDGAYAFGDPGEPLAQAVFVAFRDGGAASSAPLVEAPRPPAGVGEVAASREAIHERACPDGGEPGCWALLFSAIAPDQPFGRQMQGDIDDWAAYLRAEGCNVRENAAASGSSFRDGLGWLRDNARCCDRVLVYFMGHGWTTPRSIRFTLTEGMSPAELRAELESIESCHQNVIIEACHSGQFGAELANNPRLATLMTSSSAESTTSVYDRSIFAGATTQEEVNRRAAAAHGTNFGQAILAGIRGARTAGSGFRDLASHLVAGAGRAASSNGTIAAEGALLGERNESAECSCSVCGGDWFSCCYLACDAGGGLACLDPCDTFCSPFRTPGTYEDACVQACGAHGTEVWAASPDMASGCASMASEGAVCAGGCTR